VNSLISKPRPVLLGIYRKEVWDNYQFSIIELFVFDRFFNWAMSEQMESIERGNIRFFLIDYNSLAPCWGMSVIYLKKIMLHLSGSLPKSVSTNLRYPLINHTEQDAKKIWHSYYTFEKNVMNTIISWDTLTPKRKIYLEGFVNSNGLFSKQDLIKLIPDKNPTKKPLCALLLNTEKILIELDRLHLPDNRKLFSFTLPTDHKIYTKSMKKFQDALYDLYEGRFLSRHKMEDWFLEKNNFYIADETTKEINRCKGNWNQISMVLQCSANNYISWFELDRESENKDWLTRDIGSFMFNPINNSSMFYITILRKATKYREVIAENMYNKLPTYISNKFSDFYKDEWDGLAYWKKIHDVYKWYKDNSEDLIKENNNYRYWFESVNKFMDGYYDFINMLNGTKYLKHFGLKCPTWNYFINMKKEEHGIDE
jgi:hypothetical protein